MSQPDIVLISGSCAALTFAARSLTSCEEARSAASSAMSTAWRWCWIISVAKETSASLRSPALAEADADADGLEPVFMEPMS
ncbi:hypothetical protein [Streptomyces sp. NPDC000878]